MRLRERERERENAAISQRKLYLLPRIYAGSLMHCGTRLCVSDPALYTGYTIY